MAGSNPEPVDLQPVTFRLQVTEVNFSLTYNRLVNITFKFRDLRAPSCAIAPDLLCRVPGKKYNESFEREEKIKIYLSMRSYEGTIYSINLAMHFYLD